ncbi:MAG TPA: dihydroorotate dehydrogenase [Candidatus Limnocylindria bacterium]|jgi:dihydroorotate dehydrogenase (NAD+) catalytic subunit|nr:dihydroorotate dehydrogenase [Candidatus Limnocylindria bacterium]
MPWRRQRKPVERPIDVRRGVEESLEQAAAGEEEEDLVEIVDLDGATLTEAATGEPDEDRAPTELADKLRETLAGAVISEVRAAPRTPPGSLPEHGVDLSVEAARGLWLKNPVIPASGTFGQGVEYAELIDVSRLGAFVNKGTTPRARPGNPQYRIAETPAGILNSIGLENPGAEEVARRYGKVWAKLGVPVIVNVAGYSVDDYVFVVDALAGTPGVVAFELNVSCPNVEGGMLFGSDPRLAADVTRAVKERTDKPVIVKMTPNAPDQVVAVARAVEDAGADGITTINTVLGMRIDLAKRRPVLGTGSGGLSGPAIRPIAVHMTYQVAQAVSIPVIGAGGVTSANDALEFLMAGASSVQVGTATFADPTAPLGVIEGLAAYVKAHGLASIRDVIGAALPRSPE